MTNAICRMRLSNFGAGLLAMGLTVLCSASVQAAAWYVATNGSDAAAGTNWLTAKQTIQAAVDLAVSNDVVLVSNGVYATGGRVVYGAMTNRVAITNAVIVRSVNGPAVTSIKGQGPFGNDAVRCVYLGTNASLIGFTLTNGATLSAGHAVNERSGGGLLGIVSSTISNCIIRNCAANFGGGSSYGNFFDCTFLNNTSTTDGGGAYVGVYTRCRFEGNAAAAAGGGVAYSTVISCMVISNRANYGGGLRSGSSANSTFTYNTSVLDGGGVYSASVTNCLVMGNQAGGNGGGVSAGNGVGCAIIGNTAVKLGGGVHAATLSYIFRNSTIAGNRAAEGGGAYGCRHLNGLVYDNTAAVGPNWSGGVYSNACSFPMPPGTGNITNNPALAGSYQLSTASPCIGAGDFAAVIGADIHGEPWNNPPSIGCDEINVGALTGPLVVTASASLTNVAVGYPVLFRADIIGRPTTSLWSFADGTFLTNRAIVERPFATAGTFNVVLTAFNESFPAGVSATITVQVADQVIHYVDINNPAPLAPYTNWATAATNIQQAIDEATQPGALVLVSNGIYSAGGKAMFSNLVNRIAIDKMITVRSVNGPAGTTILGAGPLGDTAVRCAYVGNFATLSGFTLSGGHTRTNGSAILLQSGGGAWCEPFGAISNCVFSGNTANNLGGGARYGTIRNCLFTNNTALLYGGGCAEASVSDSTFAGNSAGAGGANYAGTLDRCELVKNVATSLGGGAFEGTLNNCVVRNNSCGTRGGGANSATLNGCALFGNISVERGGGADGGILRNCTIVYNSVLGEGGGTYGGSNLNSIVYYNSATMGPNWSGAASVFRNTCTTPMPAGTSNISDAPLLASVSHLSDGSPCIGAGNSADTSGRDIDGEDWAPAPAMGCDEVNAGTLTGAITVAVSASATNVGIGAPVEFRGDISGRLTRSVWNLGDGTIVSNAPVISHAYAATGLYAVVLSAFNESFPAGVSATVTVQVADQVIHYVNINNTAPLAPYTNWATAATNIQHAIDVATQIGALILVSNGTYNTGGTVIFGSHTNRVAINKPVAVRSVNGPLQTFIIGVGGVGNAAVRCVYVGTNAILSGFTLSTGGTRNPDTDPTVDYYREGQGGGAWCEISGMVSNCVITSCSSYYSAGGIFRGTVYNSTVKHCVALWSDGGGASGATFYDSTIVSNSVQASYASGGGVFSCTLYDCLLTRNSAPSSAGGALGGLLIGCTIVTNWAPIGGGASGAIISNCVIALNSATTRGGGVNACTVYDSTFTNNYSQNGGGAYGSTLENCLLIKNQAGVSGGGSHSSTAKFCQYISNVASLGNGGGAHGGDSELPLYNCLAFGNTAAYGGGVADVGMYNCTVAGNTATIRGGGLYVTMFGWSPVHNCIIYSNNAPTDANWHTESVDAIYSSCSTPKPNAANNITDNPQFVDLLATNLRLQATSPCINTGVNANVATTVDLDGNPRISGGTVDMGAYELQEGEPDADGDGIPDWWESLHYGGATNANPAALAFNGVNTVLEAWIADLNPTNPASVFVMTTISNAPGGAASVIASPGSTARVYQLFSTTNLAALPQTWPPYGPVRTGTGAGVVFTVTNDAPRRSYRTGVQAP